MFFRVFRRYRFLPAVCLAICMLFSSALGEIKMSLAADDWSWEEGSASFFHGTIQADHSVSGATLCLSVNTRLTDSGSVVFTSLNGKKLKTKQRNASVQADLSQNEELEFAGQWFLPEEMDTELAYAVVRLQMLDADGKEICSETLEAGSKAADDSIVAKSPVTKAVRAIRLLVILAAVLWMAAIGRYMILKARSAGKE